MNVCDPQDLNATLNAMASEDLEYKTKKKYYYCTFSHIKNNNNYYNSMCNSYNIIMNNSLLFLA